MPLSFCEASLRSIYPSDMALCDCDFTRTGWTVNKWII